MGGTSRTAAIGQSTSGGNSASSGPEGTAEHHQQGAYQHQTAVGRPASRARHRLAPHGGADQPRGQVVGGRLGEGSAEPVYQQTTTQPGGSRP